MVTVEPYWLNCRPGTWEVTLVTSFKPSCCSVLASNAVTDVPTSCRFCSRFCAVTTISASLSESLFSCDQTLGTTPRQTLADNPASAFIVIRGIAMALHVEAPRSLVARNAKPRYGIGNNCERRPDCCRSATRL